MIPDDEADVRQLLANLPAGEPDSARVARVRERCRAELQRRLERAHSRPPAGPRSITAILEPAIVGGFCLLYLFGVIVMVLRSEGIL